jgi:chorismate mutase/prephenate dehydratase
MAEPPNEDLSLEPIRQEIDEIDRQIQALLSKRASLARQVGNSKQGPRQTAMDFYRPDREARVLRGVAQRNEGPLSDEEMIRLFREIMSACLAQQEPLKVAFLGPEGTFSQAAVLKHFGHSVRALPVPSIDEVFRDVETGVADFGIVPVENSSEGGVTDTLDMFLFSTLKICGEEELRIRQHLLGHGTDMDAVRKVYSHQQSLSQCRAWLEQKLPHAQYVAVSSNAEAARLAREEEGAVAIAGDAAADVYGLDILMANIEDKPDNTTRFLVIGRETYPPSGRDKTSLLLSSRHKAGALHELLVPLARHKVSMTRIESRPSRRGKWDYVFFVDVEGHAQDPAIAAAFEELEEVASLFRVLGSYPCAIL